MGDIKTLINCKDCSHWVSVEIGEIRCPSCEKIRELKQNLQELKQEEKHD